MTKELLRITVFTDPTCPYGFSAAPDLLALKWLYGDQLDWQTRLVVLAEERREIRALGISPEWLAENEVRLATEHGMPITRHLRPHLLASRSTSLAIKAVQLNRPELGERYLRALQVAWHSDRREIDVDETIFEVAEEIGIDRDSLIDWRNAPETIEALEEDVSQARDPMNAARGPLDHKLAGPEDARRYTCPSLEFTSVANPSHKLVAPGFQNHSAYDLMIANAEPSIERRAYAKDPIEVLRWADWPLAAVEVGRVMGIDRDAAEEQLEAAGAINDRGYWSDPALRNEDQLSAGPASADRLVCSSGV